MATEKKTAQAEDGEAEHKARLLEECKESKVKLLVSDREGLIRDFHCKIDLDWARVTRIYWTRFCKGLLTEKYTPRQIKMFNDLPDELVSVAFDNDISLDFSNAPIYVRTEEGIRAYLHGHHFSVQLLHTKGFRFPNRIVVNPDEFDSMYMKSVEFSSQRQGELDTVYRVLRAARSVSDLAATLPDGIDVWYPRFHNRLSGKRSEGALIPVSDAKRANAILFRVISGQGK